MKINWKVRIRNPLFWATIIPVFCTFAYAAMACLGITPAISEESLVNALLAIVSALATLGVLVDPTTKGVNDSDRAMDYSNPV